MSFPPFLPPPLFQIATDHDQVMLCNPIIYRQTVTVLPVIMVVHVVCGERVVALGRPAMGSTGFFHLYEIPRGPRSCISSFLFIRSRFDGRVHSLIRERSLSKEEFVSLFLSLRKRASLWVPSRGIGSWLKGLREREFGYIEVNTTACYQCYRTRSRKGGKTRSKAR